MNPKAIVIFAAVATTTLAASAVAWFFLGFAIADAQKNVSLMHALSVGGGIFLAAALTFAWYFFGAIRAFFLKTTVYEEMAHEIAAFHPIKDILPGIFIFYLFFAIGATGIFAPLEAARREGGYFLVFSFSFAAAYFPLLALREKVIKKIRPA